jgi:hypothetical protein
MEFAALVALRLPPTILRLACAELAEVLDSLGHDIFEQFYLDPPQLLSYLLMSVNIFGVTGRSPAGDPGRRLPKRREEKWRGVRGKDTIWGTRRGPIPPRVISKKTTGLASVVSAMVVAVQDLLQNDLGSVDTM